MTIRQVHSQAVEKAPITAHTTQPGDSNINNFSEVQTPAFDLANGWQWLFTTLEWQQQIEWLFQQLAEYELVDKMHYTHNALNISQHYGQGGIHSTQYELNIDKEYLGKLTLYRAERYAQTELTEIEKLLSKILLPLRNSLQYQQALIASITDPLTGIGNRSAMNRSLEREIQFALRYGHSCCAAMIDLDFFKNINDQLGHGAGDEALKLTAKALADAVRNTDSVYRYGGEEFVIIFSNTNLAQARLICERIRQTIECLCCKYQQTEFYYTASVGLTSISASDCPESFLARADAALYQAKNTGRNKVCCEFLTSSRVRTR